MGKIKAYKLPRLWLTVFKSKIQRHYLTHCWFPNSSRYAKDWGIDKWEDFTRRYRDLTRGLDRDSIATVNTIISRQLLRNQCKRSRFVDIFSDDEKQEIIKIKHELDDKIIKLADDMYVWQDYYLPINSFEASVFYHKEGRHLLTTLATIKEKNILDIGGFIGDSMLILAPLTNKKVYVFEAMDRNFNLLQKTIEFNRLDNIVTEKFAIGARSTKTTMSDRGSRSTVLEDDAGDITMISVDEYVQQHGLEVGLIKVDIEGYEQEFLKGAEQTIKTQKPALLLSIYHNYKDFFDIKPIIESWNLGYKFKVHRGTDGKTLGETLLIAEAP